MCCDGVEDEEEDNDESHELSTETGEETKVFALEFSYLRRHNHGYMLKLVFPSNFRVANYQLEKFPSAV